MSPIPRSLVGCCSYENNNNNKKYTLVFAGYFYSPALQYLFILNLDSKLKRQSFGCWNTINYIIIRTFGSNKEPHTHPYKGKETGLVGRGWGTAWLHERALKEFCFSKRTAVRRQSTNKQLFKTSVTGCSFLYYTHTQTRTTFPFVHLPACQHKNVSFYSAKESCLFWPL